MKTTKEKLEALALAIDTTHIHEAKMLIVEIQRSSLNKKESSTLKKHLERLEKLPTWSHIRSYHQETIDIKLVAWLIRPLLLLAATRASLITHDEAASEFFDDLITSIIVFSVLKGIQYLSKSTHSVISILLTLASVYARPYEQLATSSLSLAAIFMEEWLGYRVPVYLKALPLSLLESYNSIEIIDIIDTSSFSELVDLSTKTNNILNLELTTQLSNQTLPQLIIIPDYNHFNRSVITLLRHMQAVGHYLGPLKTVFAVEGSCFVNRHNNTFMDDININIFSDDSKKLIERAGTISVIFGGAQDCIAASSFIKPVSTSLKTDFEVGLRDALNRLNQSEQLCRQLVHAATCGFNDSEFKQLEHALQIQQQRETITTLYDHNRIFKNIFRLQQEILAFTEDSPALSKNLFDLLISLKKIQALYPRKNQESLTRGDEAIVRAIQHAQEQYDPNHIVVKMGAGHLKWGGPFNFFLKQQQEAGASVSILDVTNPGEPIALKPFTGQYTRSS